MDVNFGGHYLTLADRYKYITIFLYWTFTENGCTFVVDVARAVLCLVSQSCPTLCDSMDWNPPGSSVHGNSPDRKTGVCCHDLLEGIFQPKDKAQVLLNAGRFFTI